MGAAANTGVGHGGRRPRRFNAVFVVCLSSVLLVVVGKEGG